MRRAALALALALVASHAIAGDGAPVYLVDAVTGTIASDEPIGVRRAGLLCVPAGPIRMKDVLPDDRLDQREVVGQILEREGLAFRSSLQAARRAPARYRIKATVRAAAFRLCDRGGRFYSGEARLDVAWRVQGLDGEGGDLRRLSSVTRLIDRGAAAPLGAIYRDLLEDAARDLARRLKKDIRPDRAVIADE